MFVARIFVGILLTILAWNSLSKSKNPSDFQDYYEASQRFVLHQDIYAIEDIMEARQKITSLDDIFLPENASLLDKLLNQTGSYIYPPTFAFLLIPISQWDYPSASLFFALVNFLALLGSIYLIYRQWGIHWEKSRWWWALAGALFVSFRFLENHANNNQVAFLLLFLILGAVVSKREWLSGLLLSLAIVIKLTPAAFLVYFFWKKRWWALGWTFVFLGFWIFLPAIHGWNDNLRYLASWNEMVLQSAMKTPLFRAWKNNQSLIATLAKYFLSYADPANQAALGMPWVELEPNTVQKIFYGFAVVFGIFLIRPLFLASQKASELKALSMVFILSVLFSGIAWVHSFSFFVFPLIYAFGEFFGGGMRPKEKKIFFLAIALLFLPNRNLLGGGLESILFMVSIYLYGGSILYFFLSTYQESDSHDFSYRKNNNSDSTTGSPSKLGLGSASGLQANVVLPSRAIRTKPIRIAVDARPLAYGVTGNSRYLAEVLQILGRQNGSFHFLLLSHKKIHPVFQSLLELPGIELVSEDSRIPGPIWLHTVFPSLAKKNGAQILWGTLQLLPIGPKICPYIVNFHDLNVHSAPSTMARWNYFQHRLLCSATLQQADRILCLSENTKRDIASHYPRAMGKCKLVYPGVNPIGVPSPPPRSKEYGKFLFTLGTLEPRKNLKTLILAFRKYRSKHPNLPFSLVAAGRMGWGKDESQLRESLLQGELESEGIYFLENPQEEHLAWLYHNCEAFAFPSLHEGFGLPLLEAMREGKICLASDIPVFREILSPELDILVPATDTDAWLAGLEKLGEIPLDQRIWDEKCWTWESTAKSIAEELEIWAIS